MSGAGALAKVLQMIASPASHAEELGRLGKVYTDAAKNSAYFEVPNKLPPKLAADNQKRLTQLNNDYGTRLQHVIGGGFYDASGNGGESEFKGLLSEPRNAGLAAQYHRVLEGRDPKVWVQNTAGMQEGSGQGKQWYPSAWDHLLSQQGDNVNLSTGLTDINGMRRSQNMASQYEKRGPAAGKSIILHPSQLSERGFDAGDMSAVADFHRLPHKAQVGLLNSLVSRNTNDDVQRIISELKNQYILDPNSNVFGPWMDKADKLGMLSPNWRPSTVDQGKNRDTASLLWGVARDAWLPENALPSTGINSLRRSAILDAADQGAKASDLPPELTDKLARKKGGQIPLGPLSQLH